MAETVRRAPDIVGQHLVQPQLRERRHRGEHRIHRARRRALHRPRGVRVYGSPIRDPIIVLGWINQLQRRTRAVGRGGPGRLAVVPDFVDDQVLVRRRARFDQTQGLAIVLQFAVELARHRNRSAEGRGECELVLGHHQKSAGRNHRAAGKCEIQSAQSPAGKVEGAGGRSIVNLEERRALRDRVIHDLVDDEFVLRLLDHSRVIDFDRHARAADQVALGVQALNGERVGATGQSHLRGPVGNGRPCHRINHPIDGDETRVDGSRAGERDEIAVGAEVGAAIRGDCETG